MAHTDETVTQLCDAVVHSFGDCTCSPSKQCSGCAFLSERDGVAQRPEKLVFARWLRYRRLISDGLSLPEPTPAPSAKLPW